MKLNLKIILLTLAVAMTVGITLAMVAAERMSSLLMGELEERGQLVALSIKETQLGRMTSRNVVEVTYALRRLTNSSMDVNYTYLTDFDGNVFAHSFDDSVPAALLQSMPAHYDDQPEHHYFTLNGIPLIDISLPLLVGTDARIHVGLSTQFALESIRQARMQLIAAALVVGLIVSALSLLLSTRLSRAIHKLALQLEDYGHGKQVNINPSLFRDGGIEVSTMADNFSRMIEMRKQAEAEIRIAATAFESQESMIITDANGIILRINHAFIENTGYSPEEVIGKTPRILKSGRHDADFYRKMWTTLTQTGTWQGEIWDQRKNGEIYPKWLTISAVTGNDGNTTHYVGSHVDITARKGAEEKIHQLAFHDPLTRLPNRLLLLDRLQQTLASGVRSGRNGALLFIDLDNFKTINDTMGHFMGDLLLQQVAERLVACVRDGDTVARLGGDEFVVMLKELSEQPIEAAKEVEVVGEKILASLRQPYQFDSHEFKSTASIGVTVFSGNHKDSEELLKQADIAMYQGKKTGRDNLYFFDPQMQETINYKVKLERELHKALELGQFQLYFQIQVSEAQTDSSILPLGAEVLIRWNHPERGMVSPAQFIPLAEETGLIVSIGQWVLDTACAQLKAWESNEATSNLLLAVNVSPHQFRQKNLVKQLKATIGRHAINPSLLKLELTENLLLEDIEETVAIMNELKDIGVRLSLDDFGTGYSSLQYLKLLPLDQIKIDQSFVRDITTDQNDAAIVQTIIAMSELLCLKVIAEGVETEMQREFLSLRGCNTFQGYLFGKPMPIDKFEAHLNMSGVLLIEPSMSAWDYKV